MARNEKAKAKMEQVKGKTKEASARAVGNESKSGEGRAERTKGDLRQAKEKAKDAFRE
ncbi:CsbD-like domain-containing protein OS=Streptomyces glaucescens OX=1907 GN=SGLAU_02380 PE=3 SV=1 [Streptomyces glaucescens]